MRRFRNILFAEQNTNCHAHAAINEAATLAKANDAKLTLYGVVNAPPLLQRTLRLGNGEKSIVQIVSDRLSDGLAGCAARIEDQTVDIEVGTGSPALEIVRKVVRSAHDLVVITTDGSSDSAALVRRVIQLCPSPVWVLRPNFTGERTLAAIDPDDDPRLNRLILDLAQSQSTRYNGELRVVHSWEPYGQSMFLGRDSIPPSPQVRASFAADAETRHRTAFQATLTDAGIGAKTLTHLVDGPPVRAITGLIALYRIDLLVMGAVGQIGGDRVLFGNTAEQVFADVPCSVLVVKPPGFVSPVDGSIDEGRP